MDAAIYQRARATGMRAIDAARLARWTPPPFPASLDGFDLTMTDEPDEYVSADDLGYGTFTTAYQPGAIRNPNAGDSRRNGYGYGWYLPAEPIADTRLYLSRHAGMSRSVAWDTAVAAARDELSRLTDSYGPDVRAVTVTASRAGVELGTASCGMVEIAWDPIRRTSGDEYLLEIAHDLTGEAIADARDTLARLVAA